MKLQELSDLITTRNYVMTAIENFSLDKETSRYMGDLKIMLDKKIVDLLKSNEFKEYIGFDDVQTVKQDAAKMASEPFREARQKLNAERGFK